MPDAFYVKRMRKIEKTIAYASGGTDQLVAVGPSDEVCITMIGTTDPFTPDAKPVGLNRVISRLEINSSLRGAVGILTGISLAAITNAIFGDNSRPFDAAVDGNGGNCVQTTAGSAFDGPSWLLPFGIDAGEICTFNFTMGTLAQMAATADLAGFSGILRMSVSLVSPKTYWGYRQQPLGAAGVIGAGLSVTQTLPPIIPNFAMVGGVITALHVDVTLASNVRHQLSDLIITMGDDYLINDRTHNIRRYMARRTFGPCNSAYVPYRHVPVANDASYQVTVGATTATISPSEIVYIYQSGQISSDGVTVGIVTPAGGTTSGVVSLPAPQRALPVAAPQPGPMMQQPGQGGFGTTGLRLTRR